jgi:hypothetical protein
VNDIVRDIAAALHDEDDCQSLFGALMTEHGIDRANEIMDTLRSFAECQCREHAQPKERK